ncbi:MAG: 3-phosphoshikimate 1-carboxyvinyltransferase, partial [Patescibacteria group bacterium]|nr:3-phosphoshikimate 1-carboxyvinyltransferase [Patescibacteria group bacterium]
MKQVSLLPLANPVTATISVPGSKSITNRALILASLCENPVEIINPLQSDDTKALISCLQTLGIKIKQGNNSITVVGNISDVKNKLYNLNAGLSGTTMRFLLALISIIPGTKILTGKKGLLKRPIKDLVDALKQLGVDIEYLEREGFPPVKIVKPINPNNAISTSGTNAQGALQDPKTISINGSISSQFLSALLMIAPVIKDVRIHVEGKLVSSSYVALTKQIMQFFGLQVIQKGNQFKTQGTCNAKKFIVEGDYSAACYFGAIAALTKSRITIKNLNPTSAQGDKEFFSILEAMGNKIIERKKGITIIQGKEIKPLEINMENCPDQIQTLAVLAAFAKGETKISGISTLKKKETDRLSAITNELGKMGIKTKVIDKSLSIFGGNPHSASIDTYGDHRMAMAFAVAGAKLKEMKINNPNVVSKTFPTFWKELKKIGIEIIQIRENKQKIVLTGFMGAGKSSVASILAKRLGCTAVEMDKIILNKSGKKSINEIFEKHGEKKFREIEQKVATTLMNKKNIIVSSGGGVIMNNITMNLLKEDSIIVFLSTDFTTIEKRLVNTANRPLWKNIEQTKKLFK